MEEIWKKVNNYEQYEVSNLGKVKTTSNNKTRKERILKPLLQQKGYFRVGLYKNNKVKFVLIHRLVAEHFIDNPENKETINHINGDKSDNSVINLEWLTYRENMEHAIENKLSACGIKNGRSKLNILQVNEIKKSKASNKELCTIYKVSKSTIDRIRFNRGWN